ncbi:uncharacterized protein [Drosophila suzukii]|uniref:RNA-directed DNA polymerase n=1 Tax=Drosophila suzukii TaxID=28584 RepID=A0ABM4U023_DROSZ
MPLINYILDQLREARYISSLYLKDRYWQIPLEENSRQYTAFTVPGKGLFQWRVKPFGLHSALATIQRVLDQVIGPVMSPHAVAYQDDIIVIGRTLEEHRRNLREVFRRLRDANLRLNPEKCQFFKKELMQQVGVCTRAPEVLVCPDFSRTFTLQTDASDYGITAILTQDTEQGERRAYVTGCSWIKDMGEKIRTQPQKYPDYVMDGETLYRHIPRRAGSKDVTSWKMCVQKSLRETVVRENHDAPSAGHVGSRGTIARLAARYYWPGMHRDARVHTELMLQCSATEESLKKAFRERIIASSLYDMETLGTGRATETTEESASKLKEVFEIVRRNIEKAFQDQARHYNLRRRQWSPAVVDFVSPAICELKQQQNEQTADTLDD